MIKYATPKNAMGDPTYHTKIGDFITVARTRLADWNHCLLRMQPGDVTNYNFFMIRDCKRKFAVLGQNEGNTWAGTIGDGIWVTPGYLESKGCRDWTSSLLAEVWNRINFETLETHYYDFEKSCPMSNGVPVRQA